MFVRAAGPLLSSLLVFGALSGCFGGGGAGCEGVPVADFTVEEKDDGVTFQYDALNSSDPDGDALIVKWNFGDGELFEGPLTELGLIEYTYAITNTLVMVTLVVEDTCGLVSSALESVTIGTGQNMAPEVHLKNTTRWVTPGAGVVLDGSKSDDHDGDLFSYEWILGSFNVTAPPEANFTSEYLNTSAEFSQVFNAEGIYLIHCHPHPWMKQRVVVGEGPNATGDTTVEIENFAYGTPTLNVKAGSKVTYVNRDPDQHTATVEWFAPGAVVSTSPILSTKLEEGEYQARIVLNDGKGGMSTKTFGLKGSTDAPPNPDIRYFNNTPSPPTPFAEQQGGFTKDETLKADWPGNLTVSIAWSSQMTNAFSYRISLLESSKNTLTLCVQEGETCTLVYDVMPGTYYIRVRSGGAWTNVDYDLQSVTIQWTYPPFGDSDPQAGDAHQHH